MRNNIEMQLKFGRTDIGKIKIDIQGRDVIPIGFYCADVSLQPSDLFVLVLP